MEGLGSHELSQSILKNGREFRSNGKGPTLRSGIERQISHRLNGPAVGLICERK